MIRSFLVVLLMVATLSGCDSDFAPASRIEGLRLLAVAADHPSAQPGQEVTLEALYHDTRGRSLAWGFAFCDSQASTAALDCLKAIDRDTLVLTQDDARHGFVMPEALERAQRDSAVGIAVIACPGEIVVGDTLGIPVACMAGGRKLPIDEFEIGVKRVFYTRGQENMNPSIDALRWDGEAWPADEQKQITACGGDSDDVEKCAAALRHEIEVLAPEAAERFDDGRDGDAQEQAVVQFYATGGSFEWGARVPESARTRFVARKKDAGKTLQLFFVVRDSRGGVSWQTRTVSVREAK